MQRLERDRLHAHFEIHEDVQVETRLFPDRAMGLGVLTDPALALPPGFLDESDKQTRLSELVKHLPGLAPTLKRVFAGAN